jgi:hypothetical protein
MKCNSSIRLGDEAQLPPAFSTGSRVSALKGETDAAYRRTTSGRATHEIRLLHRYVRLSNATYQQ